MYQCVWSQMRKLRSGEIPTLETNLKIIADFEAGK
jgi:hypothetical protein